MITVSVQIIGQEEQISPDFKLKGNYLDFTFPNVYKEKCKIIDLFDNDRKKWIFQETLDPEFEIQQITQFSWIEFRKIQSSAY